MFPMYTADGNYSNYLHLNSDSLILSIFFFFLIKLSKKHEILKTQDSKYYSVNL